MIRAKERVKSSEGNFGKKTYLFCKECGSDELVNSDPYLTCSRCGITIDGGDVLSQVGDPTHHAPLNKIRPFTLIGKPPERINSVDSSQYSRLNQMQNYNNNDTTRIINAENVILRILNTLQISNVTLKKEVLRNFLKIGEENPNKNNLKSAEKVIPILLYYLCKVHHIILDEDKFWDISEINKETFNNLKKRIIPSLTEYQTYKFSGKKKDLVKLMLIRLIDSSITLDQNIRAKFLEFSIKLLDKMWTLVLNKSEKNIAGIIATTSFFVLEKELGERFGSLCKTRICNLLKASNSRVSEFLERLIGEEKISCVKGKDKIVEKIALIIGE